MKSAQLKRAKYKDAARIARIARRAKNQKPKSTAVYLISESADLRIDARMILQSGYRWSRRAPLRTFDGQTVVQSRQFGRSIPSFDAP